MPALDEGGDAGGAQGADRVQAHAQAPFPAGEGSRAPVDIGEENAQAKAARLGNVSGPLIEPAAVGKDGGLLFAAWL